MGNRILLVDDSTLMRKKLADILTGGGFAIAGEATNGREGVARYRELAPDLVTMDIMMPLLSGIDATREIVAGAPAARIVLCCALGQEGQALEAIEAGALDFIAKPFEAEDVLFIVRRALAPAALARP